MNGLETVWDIDDRGGQSTVQRLGDICTKLYPESTSSIVSKGHVTFDCLKKYHDFQSRLKEKTIEVQSYSDSNHIELWNNGYRKIHVNFLDLGQVDIFRGSDIYNRGKLLITQMPFIEGESVINKMYGYAIKILIHRAYIDEGIKLKYLSMQNMKIVSFKKGVARIVCTDVFWDIPAHVNELIVQGNS